MDDDLIVAVIQVLKQDPKSETLREDELRRIAQEAIQMDKLQDPQWLEERLMAVQQLITAEAKLSLDPRLISAPQIIEDREILLTVLEKHMLWKKNVLDPRGAQIGGRANLDNSNFDGMDLKGLDFSCANLRGVNFNNADCSHANFSGAKLDNATFVGAITEGAIFARAVGYENSGHMTEEPTPS